MKVAPAGGVIVDVASGNQRQAGGAGEVFEVIETAGVVGAAMEFGDGVNAVGEQVLDLVELVAFGAELGEQGARQQAAGVLGDVVKGEAAFAFGGLAAADGEETAKIAVAGAVDRPEQDGAGIGEGDFGAYDQFETGFLGGDVGTHDAGQAVAIGDGEAGVTEIGSLGDELAGVGGTFEEREICFAVELDVTDRGRGRR